MPGIDVSCSLQLPTSKRFAFFFLGGPAVLFPLPLTALGPQLDSGGLEPPLQSGRDAQGLCGVVSSPVGLIAVVPSFSHGLHICCFSVPSQGLCFTVTVSVNHFSWNIAITSEGFRSAFVLLFPLYKLCIVIKNNADPVIMFIPEKTPAEHPWVARRPSQPLTGMRRERCGHSQRTLVVVEEVLSLPRQSVGPR